MCCLSVKLGGTYVLIISYPAGCLSDCASVRPSRFTLIGQNVVSVWPIYFKVITLISCDQENGKTTRNITLVFLFQELSPFVAYLSQQIVLVSISNLVCR